MGLIIPASHVLHNRKPAFQCNVCDAAWYTTDDRARVEYASHCARAHLDEVREASLHLRAPGLFGPEAGDVEWGRWVREHAASDPDGWRRWMLTGDGKSGGGIGDGS